MATEHARAVLGLNVTPFMRSLGKAQAGLGSFGRGLKNTLGFFGVGIGFAALGRSITDFADRLIDTSRKLGISTEFLQSWNHAAQQNGVSVNASNMALQRFSRRIAEAASGQGELSKTIEALKIPLRDQDGNMRKTTDILSDYADAIKGAESQQERLRLAFKAFDSEGVGMVNILQDGSAGLKQMTADAIQLGVVTEQKALRAINRLSNSIKAMATQVLGNAAEKMGQFVSAIEELGAYAGARFGGADESDAFRIAEEQVAAQEAARQYLATQENVTSELERQAELERQKEASIKEQIRLQRSDEAARSKADAPSFRDQVREQFRINRERETRARRLLFAARNFSIREDELRARARLEDALGQDSASSIQQADEMRRRAQNAASSADILRRGIMNPLENLEELRQRRRILDRAAELESDAERARRFGFFDRAQEFRSTAEGMRRSVAESTRVEGMLQLTEDVHKIMKNIMELNQ